MRRVFLVLWVVSLVSVFFADRSTAQNLPTWPKSNGIMEKSFGIPDSMGGLEFKEQPFSQRDLDKFFPRKRSVWDIGPSFEDALTKNIPVGDFHRVRLLCEKLRKDKNVSGFCKRLLPIIEPLAQKSDVEKGFYASYPEDIYTIASRAIAEQPEGNRKSKEVLVCQAILYRKLGDYRSAAEKLDAVLKLSPKDASLFAERGEIYYRQEKPDMAKAFYEKALAIDPDSAEANFGLSIMLSLGDGMEKHSDRIKSLLAKAVESDPRHAWAHIYLGIMMAEKGEEGALKEMETAIRLDPANAYFYVNHARPFVMQEKYDDALADVSKAIELCPHYAKYYFLRSQIYFDLNEIDKAGKDARQAYLLEPDNAKYAKQATAFNHKKKRYFETALLTAQGMRLDPQEVQWHIVRADAYASLSMYPIAERELTKAIDLNPTNPSMVFICGSRGWTRLMQEKYYDAEKDLRYCFENGGNENEMGLAMFGMALFATSRYQETVEVLTKLIEMSGKAKYYGLRGCVYEKLGQFDEARKDLKKAQMQAIKGHYLDRLKELVP